MASRMQWCDYNGKKYPRSKPWKARVKINWIEYFLGYFATREEAEMREREFKNAAI